MSERKQASAEALVAANALLEVSNKGDVYLNSPNGQTLLTVTSLGVVRSFVALIANSIGLAIDAFAAKAVAAERERNIASLEKEAQTAKEFADRMIAAGDQKDIDQIASYRRRAFFFNRAAESLKGEQ